MTHSYNSRLSNHKRRNRIDNDQQGFTCVHCGLYVTCASIVSGVQNRNHCPVCLWSRHLDWRIAGDRLSSCRAPMRPVGLTTKRSSNKYASERDGELMIVHCCTGCQKVVINRIAADDSTDSLIELFEGSIEASETFHAELAASGVAMLAERDRKLVLRRLFGPGMVSQALIEEVGV